MSRVRLIIIGAAVLAVSFVVIIRNKSLDDELLASVGALGGLAIILNAVLDVSEEKHESEHGCAPGGGSADPFRDRPGDRS